MNIGKYIFDYDYSEDYVSWLFVIDKNPVKKLQGKNSFNGWSLEDLNKLQSFILKENKASYAFYFASDYGYNAHLMQSIILANKDPKYSYLFAKVIPNADVKRLQSIVLESKKIKYICNFACFVPSANINSIESFVLKSNKAKYAHLLLKHIPNLNINKYKKIIFSSKKPRYIFEFSRKIKNKNDFNLAQDLIIASKSCLYIRLFAQKNKLANISKLENAIIETGNLKQIKKFAKAVKGSKLKNFLIAG